MQASGVTAIEYRAQFDATVTFSNGGRLTAEAFRVDIPDFDVREDQVAALFVASLGLLMTDRVDVRELKVFAEAHKGTRGGPSDTTATRSITSPRWRWVELNHVINAGM